MIQRLVAERFGGALRIGIGINTGLVIAGNYRRRRQARVHVDR
jgi:class 3 adenylate cyclase